MSCHRPIENSKTPINLCVRKNEEWFIPNKMQSRKFKLLKDPLVTVADLSNTNSLFVCLVHVSGNKGF